MNQTIIYYISLSACLIFVYLVFHRGTYLKKKTERIIRQGKINNKILSFDIATSILYVYEMPLYVVDRKYRVYVNREGKGRGDILSKLDLIFLNYYFLKIIRIEKKRIKLRTKNNNFHKRFKGMSDLYNEIGKGR